MSSYRPAAGSHTRRANLVAPGLLGPQVTWAPAARWRDCPHRLRRASACRGAASSRPPLPIPWQPTAPRTGTPVHENSEDVLAVPTAPVHRGARTASRSPPLPSPNRPARRGASKCEARTVGSESQPPCPQGREVDVTGTSKARGPTAPAHRRTGLRLNMRLVQHGQPAPPTGAHAVARTRKRSA